jgi:O-Antigen ligase
MQAGTSAAVDNERGHIRRRRRSNRSRPRRRHHRQVDAQLAERWVLGAQCAVVVGSLMAIGTVHVPVLLVVASVTLAIPVAIVGFGLQTAKAKLFVAPAVVLALLSAYSLLQAVPMPMAWLKTLSPGVADIWSRCLLPFGDPGPKMASLSADPGASLREALKWITYAAAFGSAAVLGARRGLRWAVTLIFGAAVLAAFTTIVHGLLGLHKVYGVYEPEYAHLRWGMGPLLNPNNLAGYLNLGSLCGFGLMLSREGRVPRWLVGFGIATLVGTTVIAASRAGAAALPAGVLVFWLLTRRNERVQRSRTGKRLWKLSILAFAAGLVLAVFAATQQTSQLLFHRDLEKLQMVGWAVPLVRKFPWFGIGRGASESVFAAFRQAPGHTVFTHIENFAVEWIAEWGVPVAVCALVALCWYLRPSRLRVRESLLAASAVAAAVTLLGQNFFDLGLEVPSVCLALTTLLGAAYGAAPARAEEMETGTEPVASRGSGTPSSLGATGAWIGLAPLAVIALMGTAQWGRQTDLSDRNELHDAFATLNTGDRSATSVFYSMLHQAMLRHPAEPYFPLMGGIVAWSANRDALPWLTRSLERDPLNGVAHFAAACVVAARNRLSQALLELKFAGNDDSHLVRLIGRIAVGWTHDEKQLRSILPDDDEDAARMLTSMAQALTDPTDAALRMSLLRLATQRDPENVDARVVWAGDLIADLGPQARTALCQDASRKKCVAEVRDQIGRVATLDPGGANALNLTGELLLALGRTADATRLMADQCPKLQHSESCAQVWLALAAKTADLHSISDAVDEVTSGCRTATECAAAYTYAGSVLMREGMPALALTNYQRAALGDSTPVRWLKVADAASEAGAHSVALEALQRVKDEGGDTPDIERRMQDERRRVAATLVGAGE